MGATQAFEGLNEKVQSALEEAEHARHENEEVVELKKLFNQKMMQIVNLSIFYNFVKTGPLMIGLASR